MSSRAFELFLIHVLVSGCISADPCSDYVKIWMEYGQRSTNFNSRDTTIPICDSFLNKRSWYRFQHDAGNRLVEKPIDPWHCGTQAPIWLNGTHPTDTTEIIAGVCATFTSENTCGWKGRVHIRLCNESGSDYFVYKLAVPRGCPLAYCVDAASRKQCMPPLVWLADELRCGEEIKISTPAPTRNSTSVSPVQLPSSSWGQWGPWSDCPKSCDYGLQMRYRTCGQLPCSGDAASGRLCAMTNCEELPQEKDKGIVLILQCVNCAQDTMDKVVQNMNKIKEIVRININIICHRNKRFSSPSIEYVGPNDIFPAKGFPKEGSNEVVHFKLIAINIDTGKNATCGSDHKPTMSRYARSIEPKVVSYEVMQMAVNNSASELQEYGLVLKYYFDPSTNPDSSQGDSPCPTATCIVPVVVSCIIILAIGLLIGCITLYMMKKSSKTNRVLDFYTRQRPKNNCTKHASSDLSSWKPGL